MPDSTCKHAWMCVAEADFGYTNVLCGEFKLFGVV